MGGGSSPLIGGPSSRSRSFGVFGDLGVLPPECEVRGEDGGGEDGGLSLWAPEFCLDLASGTTAMGEDVVSEWDPTFGVPRLKRRVHVTMSVLSSV